MPALRREVFDINKDPIVCPKCGTVFQGASRAEPARREGGSRGRRGHRGAGVELVSLDEVEAGPEKAVSRRSEEVEIEDDEAAARRDLHGGEERTTTSRRTHRRRHSA